MLKKYKIALSIIIILVACCGMIGIGYLYFEKNPKTQEHTMVFVDGDLSFNYINGQSIDSDYSNQYEFSITNTSSVPYYYYLVMNEINTAEGISFEVQSNREGFQSIQKPLQNGNLSYSGIIKINGNETHSYSLTFDNPEKKKITGKLQVELEKNLNNFANIVLKNNILNEESRTNLGDTAREEEGLIESSDDNGTSYYFRGNSKYNYVSFANHTWRIVKINGDGTVKLVLNELINNNTQFYKENFDLNFENSNIYHTLLDWYQQNLNSYDNVISIHKFCTDATTDENGYSSITRIYTNKDPIFQCLGTTNTLKIGLLTADELSLAGASNLEKNEQFYLYNDSIKSSWWTMSPAKSLEGNYSFIEVSKDGQMNTGTSGNLFRGIRPVINLIKKVTVTGSGTIDDPYVVNNV